MRGEPEKKSCNRRGQAETRLRIVIRCFAPARETARPRPSATARCAPARYRPILRTACWLLGSILDKGNPAGGRRPPLAPADRRLDRGGRAAARAPRGHPSESSASPSPDRPAPPGYPKRDG